MYAKSIFRGKKNILTGIAIFPRLHILPHHLPRLGIYPIEPPVHALVTNGLDVEHAFEFIVKTIHSLRELGEEHRRIEPPPHLVQCSVDDDHRRVRSRDGHFLAINPVLHRSAVARLYHEP